MYGQIDGTYNINEDTECRSAGELQKISGYTQCYIFSKAVDTVKEPAVIPGKKVSHHFDDISKMVILLTLAAKRMMQVSCTFIFPNTLP